MERHHRDGRDEVRARLSVVLVVAGRTENAAEGLFLPAFVTVDYGGFMFGHFIVGNTTGLPSKHRRLVEVL